MDDTLSVDTSPVSLLIGGSQTVAAKVLGSNGWTISAVSSAPGVASASVDEGEITITGASQGSAEITVSAEKDGTSLPLKTIPVTVAPSGSTAVKPSGGTVTDNVARFTVDGTFVTTNESSVDVGGSEITISASKSADSTEITISAAAAQVLYATGKDVVMRTSQGSIKLDAALMHAISTQKDNVVLSVGKVDKDEIEFKYDEQKTKITSLYELKLTKGSADGSGISFGAGRATMTVSWAAKYGYAYTVENGELMDVLTMVVTDGKGSWTIDRSSVWALSRYEDLLDAVGIRNGTYSVPITIKQASQPSKDSMARDATGRMVVAEVTDSGVTYTMFLKARIGTELGDEPLRGHLIKMWYYAPDDTEREYPIPATVVRTYRDKDMYGDIDTFPREVDVWQEGEPRAQYYIQVYVDAMGTNYQDALVKLDWDKALDDGGEAARKGFEDESLVEKIVKSGETISRSNLEEWIEQELILIVQGADEDLTAEFDARAMQSLYDQSTASFKIYLKEATKSNLTSEQKEAAGSRPIYQMYITTSGDEITELERGKITVTIPYSLKRGENADALVIWLVDEDGDFKKIKCSYDSRNKTVEFDTDEFGVFVIGYDEEQLWVNPFTDVSEEDWFYEAVKYVIQKGLFNGTSETTFSPYKTMSRGMLVTVLYRLDGSPEASGANPFTDVPADMYYVSPIIWGTQNGIISGYGNGLFKPDSPVTREQMVTILYNYAKYKGYDVSLVKGLDNFTDRDRVSSYAVRAMQWAVANGTVTGTSDTTLSPKGGSTRAQVAAVLMRFDESVVSPAGKAKETTKTNTK
ncbi:MAG: S-layer homology domain-containing protein [Oscillospiraceae bacterium]|nr:S-layer homology domain-containing protein [Oscillospiraceae bacterium]